MNMEDNEDAESTKSEVKLGKLQFSLDYDFQKGEVRPQSLEVRNSSRFLTSKNTNEVSAH